VSSAEENNKAVVRRFIEVFYNRKNMDVADELLAPDFVARDALTGEEASIVGYKREIAEPCLSPASTPFSTRRTVT
jgi:ketosteroid isomerase-like protein